MEDKLRTLTAVKEIWGNRVTAAFPRQGRYALDEKAVSGYPPADHAIGRIGDLIELDFRALAEGCAASAGGVGAK